MKSYRMYLIILHEELKILVRHINIGIATMFTVFLQCLFAA